MELSDYTHILWNVQFPISKFIVRLSFILNDILLFFYNEQNG